MNAITFPLRAYAVGFLMATGVLAQSGGGFDLTWNTIDGGGYMWSSGGPFTLGGTIGQPDAGPVVLSGGPFSLEGGFWAQGFPTCTTFARADFDRDCDVDHDDYMAFEACGSGPDVPLVAGCEGKDLDHDGDADQDDFGIFQCCWSGDQPADPSCAE